MAGGSGGWGAGGPVTSVCRVGLLCFLPSSQLKKKKLVTRWLMSNVAGICSITVNLKNYKGSLTQSDTAVCVCVCAPLML